MASPAGPSARRAVLLGILQGPSELLPISSSAHITLIPWLLGHPLSTEDPELRKSLEVAVHAGTAIALVVAMRGDLSAELRELNRRRAALILASVLPPSLAGLALQSPIERRMGTPRTIAWGLLAGSALMAWADRLPQQRRLSEANWVDGLWLGCAQAAALIPGISRSGATLGVARSRGFGLPDSAHLARQVALPVILGATALSTTRLSRRQLDAGTAKALLAGALSAATSTLVASRWVGRPEQVRRLAGFALYRSALAAATFWRLAQMRERSDPGERAQ
jgi:undecaprenyl-diphosphatase